MSTAVAEAQQIQVPTTDGRVLNAYLAGDPEGQLVIVHHGTPCSGLLAGPWAEDAAARGIRLVGFDRAGYGGSPRNPGRRVADVAADTEAVAVALDADRFRCWGTSGGGPHALACAALLPDRVIAAASVAGVAPFDADGLDWLAGMGQDNQDEFGAARLGEQPLRRYLEAERGQLLDSTPDTITQAMETLLPAVDRAVLTDQRAEFMHAWMTTGLRSGCDGWLDDDLAFTSGWGFEVSAIRVPVLVVQGEHDLIVPFAHGRWLAEHIPGADGILSPDDGHLTVLERIGRTHQWLLDHQ